MSLQRRLLLYLVLAAPLVWLAALADSVARARHEVNELFDTEIVRLAYQVQATLAGVGGETGLNGRGEQPEQAPQASGAPQGQIPGLVKESPRRGNR